jgi:lysophospholipase L1-like esterase
MPATPQKTTPLRFKVYLALLSLVVSFGLCEVVARIAFPAPPDPTRQPQITYLYDPEIRYVNVPNQRGWIDDGFVTMNSRGFRGRETDVPKPRGRFRIVTVGDSLTLGWGVGDEETFSARLEQFLHEKFPDRNLDVVNLGVGGYDTRQEVTLLKRHVDELEPDLVVIGFYSNDVPDSIDDDRALADAGTRVVAANPQRGQVLHMNPAPDSSWETALRKSRAAYTIGRALKRFAKKGEWGSSRFSIELDLLQGKDSPELDQAWAGIEKRLGDLRALAASRFAVDILVLPCREQVAGQYPTAKYQSRVRDIADRLGFAVIDPLPALIASRRPVSDLFIPYDRNHPSAAGHRIIADTVSHYIAEHQAPDRHAKYDLAAAPMPGK